VSRVGIDREFLWEFGKLDRSLQDKVAAALARFEDTAHAGRHLEPIKNALDPRLRSIRIDQFWRGVVLAAPESDDVYALLKVLPHDDAYTWARRQRASVNRATGVIELRDVVAIDEQVPHLTQTSATADRHLFGDVKDGELRRLGIDEHILGFARTLTAVDQLEAARPILPEPQYDVLLGLASGMTPDEVWAEVAGAQTAPAEYDPEDLGAALVRSTRRMVLVSGPDELMEVFSYPFAQWRVYLHEAQHRAAFGSFSGPARVTGGPGTGKTVAAVHRAAHLAKSSPADRSVLLTTFTKTLASSLEDSLNLLTDDDAVLRRIDVRHLDQVANRITAQAHGRLTVVSAEEERQRWAALIKRFELEVSEAFLGQEWRQVVLAQNITGQEQYLTANRGGRGRQLGPRQRERLWPALEAFGAQLRADGRWTHETICVEATRLLAGQARKPYRHVIIDEAQDFSPWQWRLIRAAVDPGPNDIFLAGDTHQRIYGHRVSLKRVGIDIAGRSERLKINYRTTAEILAWSLALLHGERVDDMNDQLDTLAGCRSEVHGVSPVLHGVRTAPAELDHLATTVRAWLDQNVEPDQIGVAARTTGLVDNAVAALARQGIPAVSLARRAAEPGEVQVATMHRMKGLEFRCVAVIGTDALPLPSAVTPVTEDQYAHELDVQRERCLLFVACTRAREQLAVSWHGASSPLLPH
jgi:UvrD-like helicase family protein